MTPLCARGPQDPGQCNAHADECRQIGPTSRTPCLEQHSRMRQVRLSRSLLSGLGRKRLSASGKEALAGALQRLSPVDGLIESGASGIFLRMEVALRQIMATPRLRDDVHFQNLMARLVRAGTLRDFQDRIADIHFYIRRVCGQGARSGSLSGAGAASGGPAAVRQGRAGRVRVQL